MGEEIVNYFNREISEPKDSVTYNDFYDVVIIHREIQLKKFPISKRERERVFKIIKRVMREQHRLAELLVREYYNVWEGYLFVEQLKDIELKRFFTVQPIKEEK